MTRIITALLLVFGVAFAAAQQINSSGPIALPAAASFSSLTVTGTSADTSYSYQTPSTGFTITLSSAITTTILDPAGTLATGTITMPATPADGQLAKFLSTQIVTALTMSANGGQSIKGALTALALGSRVECIYRATGTTWYC